MTKRTVHCAKLNKDAEGLDRQPFPGELGKKIYDHISKEEWDLWLNHQTMLINEHQLSMVDPQERARLAYELERFLFNNSSVK